MKLKKKWAKLIAPLVALGLALGLGLSGKIPMDRVWSMAEKLLENAVTTTIDEVEEPSPSPPGEIPYGLPVHDGPERQTDG